MAKFLKIITIAILTLFSFSPISLLAQTPIDGATVGTSNCILKGIPILQGFCGVSETGQTTTGSLSKQIASIFASFVTLFIIIVLVIGVIYTIKAALTYVQAEGDEKKVGSAKASMKSVLLGIGTMFIALVGLVLLQTLFVGADGSNGLAGAIENFLNSLKIFGGATN